MPDSENMRTYIAAANTDAASKALSKELNRIHQRVEDNLSTIGERQLLRMLCYNGLHDIRHRVSILFDRIQAMMRGKRAQLQEVNRKRLRLT